MTREAINELKKYTLGRKNTEKVEISVLQINRVIKALEQEPCEDAISRQAVEEMIKAEMPERGMWEIEGDKEKETVCEVCVDLIQKLSQLPPVKPQTICEEREKESVHIMQDELISRQAVLASIKNLYPDMPIVDIFGARRKWLEKYAPYFECENAVEQLPSVNPQETKTGHWIVHEKPYGIRYLECPYCNIWYLNEHLIRNSYCPNCGAKMESDT